MNINTVIRNIKFDGNLDDTSDPQSRISAIIQMDIEWADRPALLHIQMIEVNEDGNAMNYHCQEDLDAMARASFTQEFRRVTFNGRQYVVIAMPFGN